jgi:hypothetical protein
VTVSGEESCPSETTKGEEGASLFSLLVSIRVEDLVRAAP